MSDVRGSRLAVVVAGALVAALLLGSIWLGTEYWVTQSENEVLRTQAALADVSLKTTQAELEAEHVMAERLAAGAGRDLDISHLRVASLLPTSKGPAGAVAVVVWDSRDARAVFTASGLPASAAGEHYELWRMQPTPERVAGFTVGRSGEARFAFPTGALSSAPQFAVGTVNQQPARASSAPGPLILVSR